MGISRKVQQVFLKFTETNNSLISCEYINYFQKQNNKTSVEILSNLREEIFNQSDFNNLRILVIKIS